MNVAFRAFSPEDRAELESMALALYVEDPGPEPMSAHKVRATIRELTEHPRRGRLVVFDHDGTVVGYSILIGYWSNEYGGEWINVDELYVKPAWRGRGIAGRFLEHLERSRASGELGIQLEVMPGNTRARALYERLGFRLADNAFLQKRF